MFDQSHDRPFALPIAPILLVLLILATIPHHSAAQGGVTANRDEPTAYSEVTEVPDEEKEAKGPVMRTLEAICWYPFNRFADLTDIPRVYMTASDGNGASLRMTNYVFNATWFEDAAFCLGWAGRKQARSVFFTEDIKERYFRFLAAEAGESDRDPTELGISFHFIVVGANAALSLGEGLDFLTGIIGIDLMNDDHGPFLVDKTNEAATESAEAPDDTPDTELAQSEK